MLKERRLSIAAADGTGVAQELPCPGAYCEPTDWSPGRVSHRQHSPGHDWGWRCMERVARGRQGGPGDSFRAVPRATRGYRRTAMARLRVGGTGGPVVSVRAMSAHRGVSWCPATAAANPSGAAMGGRFSTSISKAVFVAGSVHRQPGGELTLGVAKAERAAHRIGTLGVRSDVSPDGQYVYFIDRTPAPRPSDIDVVIGWRAPSSRDW